MTSVSVLFPSSFPADKTGIDGARESLKPFQPELKLHWPRKVRARRRGHSHTDYLAGPDEERAREIVDFLSSDQKVAWFGRGGYGLTRILNMLETGVGKVTQPKRWMGYSDISALFAFCKSRELPIECIHGPMLCAFAKQPNKEVLIRALQGEATPIPFAEASDGVEFHGTLWGGNLAVLASLAGTPWLPTPTADTAVFLEDVDEAPYRVDRYLTQLYHSGFFSQTRKVILGTFTGFEPAAAVYEVAQKRCLELDLDLLGRVPVGHSEPHSPLFLDKPYWYSPSERCLTPNF